MIELTVKTLDSQNHAFSVDDDMTVAQFKQKVLEKINIPVETQRIIYCGRVLKDEHKLSEYDLNGKVVHLVQRAPPSANSQRRSRSISPQAHSRRRPAGNTMYVGSMSFPANFVEGFLPAPPPPPPPTHTLAASRLNVARRMLNLAEARLARPGERPAATAPEPPVTETPVYEAQIIPGELNSLEEWFDNMENEMMTGASVSTGSHNTTGEFSEPPVDDSPSDTSSAADSAGIPATSVPAASRAPGAERASSATRAPNDAETQTTGAPNASNISRTSAMVTHMETLQRIQTRFTPILAEYIDFMRDDPVVPQENVTQVQGMLDQVSETMHLLGHAYHSLSDVIVRANATPPRALLCCPILVHSGVVQAGVPIQVEAQINFGRNGLNISGSPPAATPGPQQSATTTQSTTAPTTATPTTNNTTPSANSTPAATATPSATFATPMTIRAPFVGAGGGGAARPVLRVLSAVPGGAAPGGRGGAGGLEYSFELMDRISFDTMGIDVVAMPGQQQQQQQAPAAGQGATNNGQTEQQGTGGEEGQNLPQGADVRNVTANASPELMAVLQQMASQIVSLMAPGGVPQQAGGPPPATTAGNTNATTPPTSNGTTTTTQQQQPQSNGNSGGGGGGAGQNSQARGNTATHPTQATRTRSTARPHVHLTEHLSMIGFDPFLRCSSHHLERARQQAAASGAHGWVGAGAGAARQQGAGAGRRARSSAGERTAPAQQGGQTPNTTSGATPDHHHHASQATFHAHPHMHHHHHVVGPPLDGRGNPIYNLIQGIMDNIHTMFGPQPEQQQQPRTEPRREQQQQQQQQQQRQEPLGQAAPTTGTAAGARQPPQGQPGVNAGGQNTTSGNTFGQVPSFNDLLNTVMQNVSGTLTGNLGNLAQLISGNMMGGMPLGDLIDRFYPEELQTDMPTPTITDRIYMIIRRNLTIQDVLSLCSGNLEPVERMRGDIRILVQTRLLHNSTTPEAVERGVNTVITEFRPFLDSLSILTPRDDIDIPASVTSLVRARLPNVLTLAASPRNDNTRALVDQLRTTVQQMVALILLTSTSGVQGLNRLLEHHASEYVTTFPEEIRRMALSNGRRQIQQFVQSLAVPNSILQPYIVHRARSVARAEDSNRGEGEVMMDSVAEVAQGAEAAVDAGITLERIAPVGEAMDVDETELGGPSTESELDLSPEEDNLMNGNDGWQNQVPSDWVPIISRDAVRQRRQSAQAALSDAYLSGMPSKRRKIVTDAKPQGSLTQVISESVRRAVTGTGVGGVGPAQVERISAEVGADASVQAAYRDLLRASVAASVRDNADLTPERFPNATAYFTVPEPKRQ